MEDKCFIDGSLVSWVCRLVLYNEVTEVYNAMGPFDSHYSTVSFTASCLRISS